MESQGSDGEFVFCGAPIDLLAMRVYTLAFGVLALSFPSAAQSNSQNAAVKYLRADIALRQSYPLPQDAASKLEKEMALPLDNEDEKLVAAADEALTEFGHGTALKTCDWSMSAEDGPLTNTAHRGAIRELVAVEVLRARLRFRDRDSQWAMDDITTAIAAARHLSLDGSLASALIAYKLEDEIVGILARNLHLLSPTQLQELRTRLNALPSGWNLGKALEAEKLDRNDLGLMADGAKSRDDLIERILKMATALGGNRSLVSEMVDGCGGSVSGYLNCIEQQRSFYASCASRFSLSPEQFEKEFKSEFDPLSKANPVIRLMTPSLPRFRWRESYMQTRRALLRAAIAVQLDGTAALKQYLDPYNGQPFSYTPLGPGFRLESDLKDGQEPLSISTVPDGDTQK